jgi:crotonobetainyl-CoA:carnitine CoA-transferase CaiB-like acyl-CoA transferase
MTGPLSHLRVVEMTIAIQGPGAGLYLRDMGAEVIKVEPPIGDLSRYYRATNNFLPEEALGSQFVSMNRGKSSVCVDIYSEQGMEAVKRLIASADVFLSNYRQIALDRMGLSYEVVRAINPKMIYAVANGFGPDCPDADKTMLDGAAIARGGLASMTGPADGSPMAPGATIADTAGAMQCALGIVTALVARERDGIGQRVQTSALGAQLWLQMWDLTHSWMTGVPLRRNGTHHPNINAPYGIYETADAGHFLFAVAQTNEAWDAFWIFADDPLESINPKWDTPAKRLGSSTTFEDAKQIQEKMRLVFKTKTTAQWDEFLAGQSEIVYERIKGHKEVLDDPQVIANNYIESMQIDHIGETTIVGNLVNMSETIPSTKGPPPELGADTERILGELGFSSSEIQSVIEAAEQAKDEMMADKWEVD